MSEDKEKLVREMLMLNKCQDWWRNEIVKTIRQMNIMESDMVIPTPSVRSRYKELQQQFDYLLKKAAFERKELIAFKKKIAQSS